MSEERAEAEMEKAVFTLGTSTRSMEDFLALLGSRRIVRVADVRSFPTSRRCPHFSSRSLAASLAAAGVAYRWFGEELGGYREGGYRAHMETPQFLAGLAELERWAAEAPTAVVCAELLPWRCHRRFIARALEERGWKVVHVIDTARDWESARRDGGPSLF